MHYENSYNALKCIPFASHWFGFKLVFIPKKDCSCKCTCSEGFGHWNVLRQHVKCEYGCGVSHIQTSSYCLIDGQ